MEFVDVTTLSFREAMRELDGVVNKLDGKTLELEESMVYYQRGVELLKYLQETLTNAKQNLNVIMGEIVPENADIERDTVIS